MYLISCRYASLNLNEVQGLREVNVEAYSYFNGQLHGNRIWTGLVWLFLSVYLLQVSIYNECQIILLLVIKYIRSTISHFAPFLKNADFHVFYTYS